MGFWNENDIGISPLCGGVATGIYCFVDSAKMGEEIVRKEFQNDGLNRVRARGFEVFKTFEGFMHVVHG